MDVDYPHVHVLCELCQRVFVTASPQHAFFLELGIAVSRGREQLFYGKVSLEDSGRQRYVACVH